MVRRRAQQATPKTSQDTNTPGCDRPLIHLESVRQVQPQVLETEKVQRMAAFFSVLSDPHRLKLLSALAMAVKILFIALASIGIATLWEAVFADVGVALLAILNASRVLR